MPVKRDGESKRRISAKYSMLISIALIIVVCAVTYMALVFTIAPRQYRLNAGETSPYSIRAPYTVIDEAATKLLKDSARDGTAAVYAIDGDAVKELESAAAAYFDAVYSIRDKADEFAGATGETLSEAEWNSELTDEQLDGLCAMCEPTIDRAELMKILTADLSELMALKNLVITRLSASLKGGVTEEGLLSVKQAFDSESRTAGGLTDDMQKLASAIFARYCGVTCTVDAQATELAREQAAAAVEDVLINRGELIVEQGDIVSAAQMTALRELNLIANEGGVSLLLGVALYTVIIFAAFIAYLASMEPDVLKNLKSMAVVTTMLLITVLLSWLTIRLDAHLTPALIAVILIAMLVDERTAIASTVLLAFTAGAASGGAGDVIFGFNSLTMAVTILVSGVVSVIAIKHTTKRGSVIAAGAIGGGAASLALLGIYLMTGESLKTILTDIGWTMGCSVVCAILAVGSLTIWERLFDVATPARLHELLNANNKLLKQLMLEAPGTYQHSVAAAALAEGAAQRIGADALLAKTAAYYHDVGKLRRPHYFMENQKSGNIHDTLSPLDSATAIIAHQRDGVTILEKSKMPAAIVRIAGEHHGNSLMTYFYYKAVEQQGQALVDIKQYRYSGNRPSTKESAIVMLADSCEAAVRSLGECTPEQMEDMVHKVIQGKMKDSDNQLSRAPITIAELQDIERSFIKTLGGLMHERIEYPDGEGNK